MKDNKFDSFMHEVEEEAKAEGAEAVAELNTLRNQFQDVRLKTSRAPTYSITGLTERESIVLCGLMLQTSISEDATEEEREVARKIRKQYEE